jgi:hypothetical protein
MDNLVQAAQPLLNKVQLKRLCDLVKRKDESQIDWEKVISLGTESLLPHSSLKVGTKSEVAKYLKKVAVVCSNL